MSTVLQRAIPDLDDAVTSYVDALMKVEEGDDGQDNALEEFLIPLIESEIDLDKAEKERLITAMTHEWDAVQAQRGLADGQASSARKLDRAQTLQQGDVGRTSLLTSGVDIESGVKGRQTQVDLKKLEKAEGKIALKREKRNKRNVYESSRLIDAARAQKSYEELYLQVNPLAATIGAKGKSRDVHLTNIELSFGSHRILSGASVTFAHGQRYGIVGRNGIGKSTLLKAMALREVNIPPHISVLYVEQEVSAEETSALDSVLSADVHRSTLLKREAQLNELLAGFEKSSAPEGENASENQPDGGSAPDAADDQKAQKEALLTELGQVQQHLVDIEADTGPKRAAELLHGLGFSEADQQHPTRSFSGGWRMRLSLARALFVRPDLLLLDEPSNNLDLNALAWLEDYLTTSWPNTLVVVSHDRAFLDAVATSIVHQHSERLDYYKGNFTQFYATRTERAKNQRREYESQLAYRQHLQAFIDRWRYNAARAAQAQSRIKILEKLPELEPPEDEESVSFSFAEADKLSPPVLQLSEVSFGYGNKPLLHDVNFKVDLDSRIGLIGPNGAGKSTLLKVLTQELQPMSGRREAHGRLRIGYFSQHHIDGLDLSVNPVVYLARLFPGRSETEYRAHLGQFGITGMAGLQVMSTLSGGQKSRVVFATLSLQHPHILLLDEPTNHLDIEGLDALMDALKVWSGGVVVVSHDTTFINTVCKELYVCADGRCELFKGDVSAYKDIIVANAKERPT